MKNVKFVKESNENIDETVLQKLFEENLTSLGDWGLKYVDHFIQIGTGIIDILAIDGDNNPVIIECKKIGNDFDKDALIQLMKYYGWFSNNENNIYYLKDLIKKNLPEMNDIGNNLSLVAIVGDIDDEIKNACWALESPIMLVTYSLIEDSNGDIIVTPKIILDTNVGGEKFLKEPKSEEDHLIGHENLKLVYEEFKRKVLEIDQKIKINPAPQDYIGFIAKKTFLGVHFKKNWIRVDLPLSNEEAGSDKYVWKEDWEWGYIHINSVKEINEELTRLIKKAYDKSFLEVTYKR